ncbi:hypothetical protein LguiA_020592 [Lonicera macranthoides]
MTASERQRKLQKHVPKGHKHEEQEQTEREPQESELVPPPPPPPPPGVQNEGPSSNDAAPVEVEKDDGRPVNRSMLQTFRYHIAYSIWKGEKDMKKIGEIGRGMAILAHLYRQLGLASRSGVKGITGCLILLVYAGVNDAHALIHGVLFGGDTQVHDMTLVANRIYDILSSTKIVKKEIEQEHMTSKMHESFPQTTSTPTTATPTPSIPKTATTALSTPRTALSKTQEKRKLPAQGKSPTKGKAPAEGKPLAKNPIENTLRPRFVHGREIDSAVFPMELSLSFGDNLRLRRALRRPLYLSQHHHALSFSSDDDLLSLSLSAPSPPPATSSSLYLSHHHHHLRRALRRRGDGAEKDKERKSSSEERERARGMMVVELRCRRGGDGGR